MHKKTSVVFYKKCKNRGWIEFRKDTPVPYYRLKDKSRSPKGIQSAYDMAALCLDIRS